MSSRGRGSWRALQFDGRVLAFVPGTNGGRVGSKAVGKPDKTTLLQPGSKAFLDSRNDPAGAPVPSANCPAADQSSIHTETPAQHVVLP